MPRSSRPPRFTLGSLYAALPTLPAVRGLTLFELRVQASADRSVHPWPLNALGYERDSSGSVRVGYIDGPTVPTVGLQLVADLRELIGPGELPYVRIDRTYSDHARLATLLSRPPSPRVKRYYDYLEPLLEEADLTEIPETLLAKVDAILASYKSDPRYGLDHDKLFAHALGR